MSENVTKKRRTATDKSAEGFTAEEHAAMKARAQELKAEARSSKDKAAGENAVLAAIDAMTGQDRTLAERVHAIIKTSAPDLTPKTWYGMPAYARDSKVVVFFQSAQKFEARYATLGFNDTAKLDEDLMWPTAYALTEWTPEIEEKILKLVQRAAS